MRRPWLLAITVAGVLAAGRAPARAGDVSVGSPAGSTPRDHQNEPAVAIDAHRPRVAVAGANDWVDAAPCPRADAASAGICADVADLNVGISGVYFSFDGGRTWTQPAYTGWTAADCDRAASCAAHEGPIRTLP
jgi:hypothetical protein